MQSLFYLAGCLLCLTVLTLLPASACALVNTYTDDSYSFGGLAFHIRLTNRSPWTRLSGVGA
jgi:hypothetical protein